MFMNVEKPTMEPNIEQKSYTTAAQPDFDKIMDDFYDNGWFKSVCRHYNTCCEPQRKLDRRLVYSRSSLEDNDVACAISSIMVPSTLFVAESIDNPALRKEFGDYLDFLARQHGDKMREIFWRITPWLLLPELIEPLNDVFPEELGESDNNLFKLMVTYSMRQCIDSDFAKAMGFSKEQIVEAEKVLVNFDIVQYTRHFYDQRGYAPKYLVKYMASIGQPLKY
mgnify:CR=1 FL=1